MASYPPMCETCVFYEGPLPAKMAPRAEQVWGQCHRFPPQSASGGTFSFPAVRADAWCGEHKRAEG